MRRRVTYWWWNTLGSLKSPERAEIDLEKAFYKLFMFFFIVEKPDNLIVDVIEQLLHLN